MLSDNSIPNKTVLNILELLDVKPQVPKPVIFKFSSEEEGLLYRLASVLKKRGYIICIENISSYRWLCIAKRCLYPDEEPLDSLCLRMVQFADSYDVTFDGWEVAIRGGKESS